MEDEKRLISIYRALDFQGKEDLLCEAAKRRIIALNADAATAAADLESACLESEAVSDGESRMHAEVEDFLCQHEPGHDFYDWAWHFTNSLGAGGFDEMLSESFDGNLYPIILGPANNDEANAAPFVECASIKLEDLMQGHPAGSEILATLTEESAVGYIREWRKKVMCALCKAPPSADAGGSATLG